MATSSCQNQVVEVDFFLWSIYIHGQLKTHVVSCREVSQLWPVQIWRSSCKNSASDVLSKFVYVVDHFEGRSMEIQWLCLWIKSLLAGVAHSGLQQNDQKKVLFQQQFPFAVLGVQFSSENWWNYRWVKIQDFDHFEGRFSGILKFWQVSCSPCHPNWCISCRKMFNKQ